MAYRGDDSWRELFDGVLAEGDALADLTFSPAGIDLDRGFDAGYGREEGDPFVAWSKNWIYFPCCYDGAEWIGKVPRHPHVQYKPKHHGGG